MVIKLQNYKNIDILIPEQYNITIAMQYSVVEMHHIIKNHFFNIQKHGFNMYFDTSQKITLFFYLPPNCLPT